MRKNIWLDEIIEAMKELNGHALYSELYELIESRGNIENFNKLKNPKAQIRGTIERFSSDSEVYKNNKSKKDIFYSVDGIGSGHWGLRNYNNDENHIDSTIYDCSFSEGRKILKKHLARERNYLVIKLAKKRYKEKFGKLNCEICGFNFEDIYGEIGEDFIEGHHIKPVSELKDGDETNIKDIIMVCSNCHRMIHRRKPWLNKDDLKTLIYKNVKIKEIE